VVNIAVTHPKIFYTIDLEVCLYCERLTIVSAE